MTSITTSFLFITNLPYNNHLTDCLPLSPHSHSTFGGIPVVVLSSSRLSITGPSLALPFLLPSGHLNITSTSSTIRRRRSLLLQDQILTFLPISLSSEISVFQLLPTST
ncbi:hypothetical protein GJ744_010796 [Endocarpon pusillum]|uniref:Uncharacterized protein n=1 Tax=Endocarpon pusillum TaxID=364733 RepID=A0A8H7E3X9_9EURO|nr:hypothetical protein GJ744_010796 [Endocarpon pusillum]